MNAPTALVRRSSLLLSFLIVACSAAVPATPSSAVVLPSSPPTAGPIATPSVGPTALASPTPDLVPSTQPRVASTSPTAGPLTVQEAAAELLVIEDAMGHARNEASRTFCLWSDTSKPPPCQVDMDVGTKYWASVAEAVGRYVDGLRAIGFPDSAAAEAATEIDDAATVLRRGLAAAQASSASVLVARAKAAQAASETESQTRLLLKDALGLPVGP